MPVLRGIIKIMKAKSIPLYPDYLPELLDPLHRTMEVSTGIYKSWREQNASSTTNAEDFKAWVNSNPEYMNADKNEQVLYISDKDELAQHQVHFVNGLAEKRMNICGNTFANKLSCQLDYRRKKKPIGLVIRADDERLYAIGMVTSKNIETKIETRIHHSSLSAGGEVLFAAEAIAIDGKFKSITDRSGHYRPDLYSFAFGLNYIKSQGVDLTETAVKVTKSNYNEDMQITYANGALFVDLYVAQGFDNPQYQGIYDSLELAQQNFATNNATKAIYFIKNSETKELYELTKENEQVLVDSFYDKYTKLLPPRVSRGIYFNSSLLVSRFNENESLNESPEQLFTTPPTVEQSSYKALEVFSLDPQDNKCIQPKNEQENNDNWNGLKRFAYNILPFATRKAADDADNESVLADDLKEDLVLHRKKTKPGF
jgi:hypothetical protein